MTVRTQTIQITITGTNDGPVLSGPAPQATISEDDSTFTFDLLSGVSDVDTTDTLSVDVSSIAPVSGDASGIVINTDGTLSVDPNAYTHLPVGGDEIVTFGYLVEDGNGGSVEQTATITITGADDTPIIEGDMSGSVTEDLSLTAHGTLTITDPDTGESSFQAATIEGQYGSLDIDSSGSWTYTVDNNLEAVQSLAAGQVLPDSIDVTSYDGTVQTIEITITGADDTLTGKAIDGYIEGATVFADADGDGVLDAGEAFAVTGDDGAYSLTNAEGRLVLLGGDGAIDAATGLTFRGQLEAPAGSSVVTPLTTIISKLVESGSAADAASAQVMVKTALGIASTEDLLTFDPIEAALSGGSSASDGLEIAKAGVVLQNLAIQAGSAVRGASDADTGTDGSLSWGEATSSVFETIATKISSLGNTELPETVTVFEELVNGTAQVAGLSSEAQASLAASADEVAAVMLSGMETLDTFSADPIAALTEMAQTASVLQHDSSADIEAAIEAAADGDAAGISTLLTSYTGTALEDAISDGVIGDVTGTLINDAPSAFDDQVSALEDTSITILASALISNDRDSDDDEITLVSVNDAENGSVAIDAEGNVVFTPDQNFFGAASFNYTVTDANGSQFTSTAKVEVTVAGTPDDYIVAVDDTPNLQAEPGIATLIEPELLLANDFDPDIGIAGQGVTVVSVSNSAGGTVELVDGQIIFTPDIDYIGDATFDYTIENTEGFSDTATTEVRVVRPPVVIDDNLSFTDTANDGSLLISPFDLLVNDYEFGGTSEGLGLYSVQNPVGGTVTISNGEVLFNRTVDYEGQASFDYTVIDSNGAFSTARAIINHAPIIGDDTWAEVAELYIPLQINVADLLINDFDPDFPSTLNLTIDEVLNPYAGSVSLSGDYITFTPEIAGEASFDYVAIDSFGVTSTGTVNIDVAYETDTVINVEVLKFDDAEITVTSFSDGSVTLTGTDGADDVINFGGEIGVKIEGAGGDDIIRGGAGADILDGGVGSDFLFGGAGDDTFIASLGDDVILNGSGFDQLQLGHRFSFIGW